MRQPCLTPPGPSPPPRRWFSIQNSQLVYQKKLKVRLALGCPTWTRGGWLGGEDRAEDADGHRSLNGQGSETTASLRQSSKWVVSAGAGVGAGCEGHSGAACRTC